MNLQFDTQLAAGYKSAAQKIRVMSETWLGSNMFCPDCGNPVLTHLTNNAPVADFRCPQCGEIYELKSKKGRLGKKIADGAYTTMIDRITGDSNPDLFILRYNESYNVTDLLLIPRFFFVPEIIEKRKSLPPTARRHGWTGCNILFGEVPEQGRIVLIREGAVVPRDEVMQNYRRLKQLKTDSIEARGWLLDVLHCVNSLENEFTLRDMYGYVDVLRQKHMRNKNVEAKIRQQLQVLREKGFIAFLGKGRYRKN